MWAWTPNDSLARAPMVFTRRLTASAVNGPPRSVSKMKAPVVLRCSSRNMRNSSPRIGWTAGLPFFALRTCSAGLRPHSTCDHSRSVISTARKPCRKATRISVAPRLGGCDQLLDLVWRQIFAGAHLGIRFSCRYFPINVVWLDQPQLRHHQRFPLHPACDLPDNALSSESRTGADTG